MANKPCVVVPNHMLEQFSREWLQLYPQARILAASIDDLAQDKRRRLVARIATGDWDAVILSRSAFERIPMSIIAQQAYLNEQTQELRRRLDASRDGRGLTVKRLEAALARAEERVKKLTDSAKDPGITFEETGIDYLMVDFSCRLVGVCHVRSGVGRALCHTRRPLRSAAWRGAAGVGRRFAGAAGRPSRQHPLLCRAGRRGRSRARPRGSVPGRA
jgi:hypothetical protein